MREIAIYGLLVLLLVCSSCVPSVHPIYSERDIVFDAKIVDVWTDEGNEETWAFTRSEEKTLTLVHTDENGKKGEFEANLVKIGEQIFLDLVPVKRENKFNDFYRGHFMELHTFVRVTPNGNGYQIAYLEPKWLKGFLTGNASALKHIEFREEIILTDTTSNIREFLKVHSATKGAFSEPITIKRKETDG